MSSRLTEVLAPATSQLCSVGKALLLTWPQHFPAMEGPRTYTGRIGMGFSHHQIQFIHCWDGNSEAQGGEGIHSGSGPTSYM